MQGIQRSRPTIVDMTNRTRVIAFYLPQFHPIPENDVWWGKGFTEWANVAKAKPQFRGHYQPHLPADLGFYDLRLPEVREAQAELARSYGITGFCYHHYWFGGKRMLERPFEEVLNSKTPDFPFCLSWANESWSRTWTSEFKEAEKLLDQTYSPEDDRRHIQYLIKAFKDERYIRVNGKPLFLIYKVEHIGERMGEMLTIWRKELNEAGIEDLYLVSVRTPPPAGFDSSVDFFPGAGHQPAKSRIVNSLNYRLSKLVAGARSKHKIFDYGETLEHMIAKPYPEFKQFYCPVPGWDNTARRAEAGALILHNSTPELFEKWVRFCADETERRFSGDEQILFINAWNEWAEGCHLEPDQKWGLEYLSALKRAIT